MLYLNGESLVKKTLRERQTLLKKSFSETEGEFVFATSMDSTNVDDIAVFLDESIKGKLHNLKAILKKITKKLRQFNSFTST